MQDAATILQDTCRKIALQQRTEIKNSEVSMWPWLTRLKPFIVKGLVSLWEQLREAESGSHSSEKKPDARMNF